MKCRSGSIALAALALALLVHGKSPLTDATPSHNMTVEANPIWKYVWLPVRIQPGQGVPGQRDFSFLVQAGGVLMLAGGRIGDSYPTYQAITDVWRSIDGGVTWNLNSNSLPGVGRWAYGPLVVPEENNLVCLTGGEIQPFRTFLADVVCSDDLGASWTTVSWSLPTRRGWHSLAKFGDDVYMVGGCCAYTTDVWHMSWATKTWNLVTDSWNLDALCCTGLFVTSGLRLIYAQANDQTRGYGNDMNIRISQPGGTNDWDSAAAVPQWIPESGLYPANYFDPISETEWLIFANTAKSNFTIMFTPDGGRSFNTSLDLSAQYGLQAPIGSATSCVAPADPQQTLRQGAYLANSLNPLVLYKMVLL